MATLDGKVAFITGAARGQGREHAVRLAHEGADIIAVDICAQIPTVGYAMSTPDDLAETVKLVEKTGRRIVAREADVREFSQLQGAFAEGVAELGRVDIVIANAGIVPIAGEDGDDDHMWRDVLNVNLTGVWNTVRASAPTMIEQGDGGSIVLISSTAGLMGSTKGSLTGMEGYTASKHGVVGLMRSFAKNFGPHRIRVNSIHPTAVATPMIMNEPMQSFFAAPDAAGSFAHLLPLDALDASDITDAVMWLVSDQAQWITGVVLPVDAGGTLR
jgi:SDR family mycofactocin-dependent oxidoreductase